MSTSKSPTIGEVVAAFKIRYNQCLDTTGNLTDSPQPDWIADRDVLLPIYEAMVLCRAFDQHALTLQRTGRLGTFASPLGQEAIGAAVASAMRVDDVMLPSYREFSAQLVRGVSLTELLLDWGGDERGSDFQRCREDFPVAVPIASQALHAVGVACAFLYREQPRVAVCFVGDGATSKGDFHEALNLAGVWRLPVIFIVSNNEWAISVPRSRQSAAQTLAQKAIAAGIHGEQVDGNDAIAIRWATERALDQARNGHGATLIEALTYRLGDHTTADDASRYRAAAAVESHRLSDPVVRLDRYLRSIGLWHDAEKEALDTQCKTQVEKASQEYLATPPQSIESIFDHLYAELPEALLHQRELAQQLPMEVDD